MERKNGSESFSFESVEEETETVWNGERTNSKKKYKCKLIPFVHQECTEEIENLRPF